MPILEVKVKEKAHTLNWGAGREKLLELGILPTALVIKAARGVWVNLLGTDAGGASSTPPHAPQHCSGLWAWEGQLGVQSCFCGSRTRQAVGPHCPLCSRYPGDSGGHMPVVPSLSGHGEAQR